MTAPRTYPHGVTCWIDTEQPDLDAAAAFYSGLFGWTLTDAVPPEAPGSYLVATLDGQDVAALAPAADAQAPAWNTYVAVDDADATAAAVQTAGGVVAVPPADAGPGGRMAVCADPLGAEFRLWQARRRPGAQLTNAPGTWNFSDLHAPDRSTAMAFYRPLFGWRDVDMAMDAGTMLQVPGYGDHLAATVDPGIHERQASAPPGFADVIGGLLVSGPGEPAHWHVTFSVADRDGSAATAERLGATVLARDENPWTRTALVRDPQGAEFTVSQFTPPDDW
ncbi:VOC family protein [Geodermatophilus sp. SYSU D00691]